MHVPAQLPKLLHLQTLRAELQRIAARNRRHVPRAAQATASAPPALPSQCPDERLALLGQWVQAVAAGYGVAVHDFATSFADGRVLCLLVRRAVAISAFRPVEL
jgi:hypothetical protein